MLTLALLQQEVDAPGCQAEFLLCEERVQVSGWGFVSLSHAPESQHAEHSLRVTVRVVNYDVLQLDGGDLQCHPAHLLPISANVASHQHELPLRHRHAAWWEREPCHWDAKNTWNAEAKPNLQKI